MHLLPAVPILATLAGLVAAFCSGTVRAQDPRLPGLRDISVTLISIGTFPNRDPAVPCFLDHDPLEQRALEMLQSIGLRTLTEAEALERHRQIGQAIARALEAQRRGERLLGLDSEEDRQRRDAIEFMRTLPGLMVLFATASAPGGAGPTCTLAVSATFRVPPAEAVAIGATRHRVFAGMLLWEAPLRAYAASEPELAALAMRQLEATIGAFTTEWRRVNGR